jgi:prepilin-type N-terminal cleavage/methylation domain-containing protein
MTISSRGRCARGFTLLELMTVVAIVGILASVALPSLQRATLRAKTAERDEVMLRIKKAVADVYVQKGSIPGGSLHGDFTPPRPAQPMKRMPNWRGAGWSDIFVSSEEVEGADYYSYSFLADDTANPPTLEIWAQGDLDGDSVPSTKYLKFERRSGAYLLVEEDPPANTDGDVF